MLEVRKRSNYTDNPHHLIEILRRVQCWFALWPCTLLRKRSPFSSTAVAWSPRRQLFSQHHTGPRQFLLMDGVTEQSVPEVKSLDQLRQQHHDLHHALIVGLAKEIAEECLTGYREKLEKSEARVAELEARLATLEESNSSRWKVQPALINLFGRSQSSESEGAAVAGDVAKVIEAQGAAITELQQDVAALTEYLCLPPPREGNAFRVVTPPGYDALRPAQQAVAAPTATAECGGQSQGGGGGGEAAADDNALGSSPSTAHTEAHRASRRRSRLDDWERQSRLQYEDVRRILVEAGLCDSAAYSAGAGGGGGAGGGEGGGGSAGGGAGGRSGWVPQRLAELEERILSELRPLTAALPVLEEQRAALAGESERIGAELSAVQASMAAVQTEVATVATTPSEALIRRLASLETESARCHSDVGALRTTLSEVRSAGLAEAGGFGGGSGAQEKTEVVLSALQAAQQTMQGQVLSLQTHLRSLLRVAETEKASTAANSPTAAIEELRHDVQSALSEVHAQLDGVVNGKADADKVEAALDTKADRWHLAHKADRAFCESLLSRFAVEVGRQLGDMEQSQTSIRESLEEAVVRLMSSSADHAAASAASAAAGGGGSGGGGGGGGTSSAHALHPRPHSAAANPSQPFTVQPMRVSSAPRTRRSGRTSPAHGETPPMGKGLLPLSIFVTGEGEPLAADPQRYAFQPRRPIGLLTPGEQTLTKRRPQTANGRLGHSMSAVTLASSASRPPAA